MSFAEELRGLRLRGGLTQEQLAERAGVSARAVSDLERDAGRLPRLSTIALLAAGLGLTDEERIRLLALARAGTTPAATDEPAAAAEVGGVAEGAEDARPEHPPGTREVGLPRRLTPVIGRERERAELSALLEREDLPLVTVTGPGGVGKTTLALDVLRGVDPDAAFVDLAPLRRAEHVLPALARAVGLEEDATRTVVDRLGVALAGRRRLVLLDNLEQVLDARTDLLELLDACPGLSLLVTSRVPTRLRVEHEYRLDPLATPGPEDAEPGRAAAYRLFADRATASGVVLEATDEAPVAAICRRLDGMPLALELAAARLGLRTPTELLADLGEVLPTLGGGPVDLPERQRSPRADLAWSQELLSEPARRLLRRIAVFSGETSVEAVREVTGGELPVLAELVDASLVLVARHADALRVRLLVPVRELGLEALAEAGEEEELVRRHAEFGLRRALSEEEFPAEGVPNLLAATEGAARIGDVGLALRLAAAGGPIWVHRGWLAEGQHVVEAVLAMPGVAEADPAARCGAMTSALLLATERWDMAGAGRWADRVVEEARALGDDGLLARALVARGNHHRHRHAYADSAWDHAEAESLSMGPGQEDVRVAALHGLAYAVVYSGDVEGATRLASEGLALARARGLRREVGEALLLLAWAGLHTADLPRQVELADQAIAAFEASGDGGLLGEALRIKGHVLGNAGQHREALQVLAGARELYRARGEENVGGQIASQAAHAHLSLGELEEAVVLAREALGSSRRHGDRWGMAMSAMVTAHVELARGHVEEAGRLADESAQLFLLIENPIYYPWCLEVQAAVAVERGDLPRVAELLAEHHEVRNRLGTSLPPFHPAAYERAVAAVAAVAATAADAADAAAGSETSIAGTADIPGPR